MIKNYNKYIYSNKMITENSDDRVQLYHLKPTVQIIKGDELLELIKNDDLDNFHKDFVGWLKISPRYRSFLFHVTSWKKNDNKILYFSFDQYFDDKDSFKTNRGISGQQIPLNPNLEIQKYIIIEPTNRTSKFDPYDEEDWDWDLF